MDIDKQTLVGSWRVASYLLLVEGVGVVNWCSCQKSAWRVLKKVPLELEWPHAGSAGQTPRAKSALHKCCAPLFIASV